MQHSVCLLCFVLAAAAPGSDQESQRLDDLIKQTRRSSHPRLQYRLLFEAAGKAGCRRLKRHGDDSVAVQAAWQTLTHELSQRTPKRTSRESLVGFVGFLEGRSRLDIPNWWSDFLIDGPTARPTWYHEALPRSVWTPKGTSVHSVGSGYAIKIGSDLIKLPDSILNRTASGQLWCRISGAFAKQHCYVAVHDDVGYPHKLACISRESGKLEWVSEVCGCWIGGSAGLAESWVSVLVEDDRVVVFGASWKGAYVHAFKAADGKDLFKFSTGFAPAIKRDGAQKTQEP